MWNATVYIKAGPRQKIELAMIFGRGQEDKSRHALLTSTDATSPSGRGQEKWEELKPHNGRVMSLCNVNVMAPQVLLLRRGKVNLLACINMSVQPARHTNKTEEKGSHKECFDVTVM